MLSWIKSLSKVQKRRIMLLLDTILVPLALLFAFAALGLEGGVINNMRSYLLLLPYMMAVAVGI